MEALNNMLGFFSSPAGIAGLILLFVFLMVYTIYKMATTYALLKEWRAKREIAEKNVKEFEEKHAGFEEKILSRYRTAKKGEK